MKMKAQNKVNGRALRTPPRDRMLRPGETVGRATTADILPRKLVVPGSRPILVTSAEPNPGD